MATPFLSGFSTAFVAACAAASVLASAALAQSGVDHENGTGPDPDGDSNPATRTYALASIGAADARLDNLFRVISFEPPPGVHGDKIRGQYVKRYGVGFGKGVKRQICEEGQRYFRYDTLCSYLAPPSGAYAAHYRDDYLRPMNVTFEAPVCAAALSIHPIGGREGERFVATLQPYRGDRKLAPVKIRFAWTQDTVRWRTMVGGFFLSESADRVEITLRSRAPESKSDTVQFLMDDFSFIETGCEKALEAIRDSAGFEVGNNGLLVTKSAQD
ncbi:MAG: hypothetical protein ACKVS5_13560 [Parvularculaceae bacterium]